MSLAQSLRPIQIDQNQVAMAAKKVAAEIRRRCAPQRIILFGSAAVGTFRFGSDLDFILIFGDISEIGPARKTLRTAGKLHQEIPVDLIFMTLAHFEAAKERGGLCYVVSKEGVEL